MFTIILKFTKGLQGRVANCLNAINQNPTINGNYAEVEYIGISISFREDLCKSNLLDLVELLEII